MSRASDISLPQDDFAPAVAQLRRTLMLVETIAGRPGNPSDSAVVLHDDAALTIAYSDVPDITRRRFDAVAAEAAAYAAVGVQALIGRNGAPVARAAAASWLAVEMRRSLDTLAQLLSRDVLR